MAETGSHFKAPPEPGTAVCVAPGILWIRIPVPLRLNHVNVWAIEEPDGWSIVDCGPNTSCARELWERLLQEALGGRPIRRLIATHGHLDHVGLAGWLTERCNVPFTATLGEWQAAQLRYLQRAELPGGFGRFLAQHGCDEDTTARFLEQRSATMDLLGPQPPAVVRIRNGDQIRLGGRIWRVIVAGGHADEHASFYNDEDRILIAGDQVLPRITPVIGVFPSEPEADPLTDYLKSLEVFEALPPDCLVLPSHGMPFTELPARLAVLRQHHLERLDSVLPHVETPALAWVVAGSLFPRGVAEGHGRLALAETLAHLHHLVTLSLVHRLDKVSDGAIHFCRAQ